MRKLLLLLLLLPSLVNGQITRPSANAYVATKVTSAIRPVDLRAAFGITIQYARQADSTAGINTAAIANFPSTYQTLGNLSTNLSPSSTKYPNVNAVVAGLGLKQDALPTGGSTSQYLRGDYTLAPFPPIPTNANYVDLASRQYSINGNKNLTGGVALQSTSRGYWLYNTSDTTNYEALRLAWNSNAMTIGTFIGGTGTIRSLRLGNSTSAGSAALNRYLNISNTPPNFSFISPNTTSSGYTASIDGALSSTGALQGNINLIPTVSQSGTASYNLIAGYVYEQSLGSGPKALLRLGTSTAASGGGTLTDKFSVDNLGNISLPIPGTSIRLTSSNGTAYYVKVSDAGALTISTTP